MYTFLQPTLDNVPEEYINRGPQVRNNLIRNL